MCQYVQGTQNPQNTVAPLLSLPLWSAHGTVIWNAVYHFPSSTGWRRSGLWAWEEGDVTQNNQPGESRLRGGGVRPSPGAAPKEPERAQRRSEGMGLLTKQAER